MAVTIKNVAAAAGVSTATVSHVFNATRFVAPETAERVREAAKQLGYIPSINASSLRSNRSKRIGLLVPSIASFFSVDILDAVEQVLVKNGYQLVLGCSHENLEREKEQVDIFNYQQIDGMLCFRRRATTAIWTVCQKTIRSCSLTEAQTTVSGMLLWATTSRRPMRSSAR